MKVPMAVVGPMLLDGVYAKGEFSVPLCTIEGTLAMSMNRGILASYLCGGTTVRHLDRNFLEHLFLFLMISMKAQNFKVG